VEEAEDKGRVVLAPQMTREIGLITSFQYVWHPNVSSP